MEMGKKGKGNKGNKSPSKGKNHNGRSPSKGHKSPNKKPNSPVKKPNTPPSSPSKPVVPEPVKPTFDYTYAPRKRILKGEYTFAVISMKWLDQERHQNDGDCKGMAASIRKFYLNNSRGLLSLQPKFTGVIEVPFNASKKNVNQAENFVKDKVKNVDYYCIVNNGVKGFSNAGGNTMHVSGADTVACHEFGHVLPIKLGHAGQYEMKNGKMDLDHTGERQSVMGRFASHLLTAPQYYALGWLLETEVAEFEYVKGKKQFFKLKRIGALDKETGLAAVRVKLPNNERDAFLSFPKCTNGDSCIALHLSTKGGSQLVHLFGKDYFDDYFTGLYIEKIGGLDEEGNMTISVEVKGDEGAAMKEVFDEPDYEHEDFEDLTDELISEFEIVQKGDCENCILSAPA